MAATDSTQVLKPYVAAENGEVVRVGLTGLVAGIVVPLLGVLITQLLLKPVFCGGDQTTGICAEGGAITAYHTAAVLVGVAIVALFASWGIYRPLPLVAGVTIALWSYQAQAIALSTDARAEFYVFSAVLSALCYGLFYWLMRVRSFPLSIVLGLGAAIGIYWTLST